MVKNLLINITKKKTRDNNNLHDKITNKVRFKFILLNNNGQK